MDKRVCSLETEYALVGGGGAAEALSRDQLADLIEAAVLSAHTSVRCNSFGRRPRPRPGTKDLVEIREGYFIENGSRIYYDVGHIEWANPETVDPLSAVLYDQAAERNLVEALTQANAGLQRRVPDGWLMLVKNNIDYSGDISYGCHENYSLRRLDERGHDVFARLADDLAPFLVTRQIFCGAGRLGARHADPDVPVAYQLSQRADFIESLESSGTREERGILNLRDQPLADPRQWRRLHIILGDSNMSELASWLKIGTMCLVLRLVETGQVQGQWALHNPVAALRQVSRNWRHAQVQLRQGGQTTALDIQRAYWKLAHGLVSKWPSDHWSHKIILAWDQVLTDFERGDWHSRKWIDWAIKRNGLLDLIRRATDIEWEELGWWGYVLDQTWQVPPPDGEEPAAQAWLARQLPRPVINSLDQYVRSHRLEWRHYFACRRLLNRLREADFRYHDINPERSLYSLVVGRRDAYEWPITDLQVGAAQRQPPQDTRAWQRGQIINQASARRVAVEMDWDKVLLMDSGRVLEMSDPFSTDQINTDLLIPSRSAVKPLGEESIQIKIISVENLGND